MSVDRNYTLRISGNDRNLATQSEDRESNNAFSEQPTNERFDAHPSEHDTHGIVTGLNEIMSSAASLLREILGPKINRISSDAQKSNALISLSEERKIETNLFVEHAKPVIEPITSFQNPEPKFASVNPSIKAEFPKIPSDSNTEDPAQLLTQVRQLHATLQTEPSAINRKDIGEIFSAVRQIRELFAEQQRNNVTRQELNRELRTLRLVMEGRK